MSSTPFPDFPLDVDDQEDSLQATTPTGDSLFSPPPLAAPSMLRRAASFSSLHNTAATPAESVALSIHYQSSDFSELDVDGTDGDDSYFNTIFATTGGNAPSFLDGNGSDNITALDHTFSVAAPAHIYATPEPVFGETKLFPLSPDQTPALNATSSPDFAAPITAAQEYIAHSSAPVTGFDGLISPQQLTKFPPPNASPPNLQAFIVGGLPTQMTPDTASSRGSPEIVNNDRQSLSTEDTSVQAPSMSHSGANPHVTVSLWGKDDEDNSGTPQYDGRRAAGLESASIMTDDGFTIASSPRATSRQGRQGVDPLDRSSAELPTSLNEEAAKREVEVQNTAVSKWLDSTEKQSPLEGSDQSGPDAKDPAVFEGVSDREVDLGNATENVTKFGRTYWRNEQAGPVTATDYEIMLQSTTIWNDRAAVLPISNGGNRHQPQTSQAAIEKFERMYQDNASMVSRAATWGTRRRSLPSISDIAEVTSGNILRKLAITGRDARRPSFLGGLRTLVRKPSNSQQLKRARGGPDDDASSYFGEAVTRDSYETEKSAGTTLSLPRSQSWGKNKQPTPSINSALISMGSNMASIGATHTRSGSVSRSHAGSISMSPPLTSPKSPLLKVGSAIGLRPRSRSEVRGNTDGAHPNLVRMLKKSGGPPVASLATANATPSFSSPTSFPGPAVPQLVPPHVQTSGLPSVARVPTPIQIPATQVAVQDPDVGDDDDDDDEGLDADDTDFKPLSGDTDTSDELIDKITPDLNGFREQVVGLNPMLAETNTFLVDRIAHQQIVRYKGLLNIRVKHMGSVKGRTCTSASLCIAQGGAAVVLDARGERRNRDPLSAASRDVGEVDDLLSPLDGAINTDSFPKDIPMPPTSTLPAEFECQLCFTVRAPLKPSDWTKHVHEDVQPFTCTWDRCREPKMFKRKADWVRHENEGHRHLEWWTCDVDECRHTCYRRDNFLQHLVREHKFPEPKHKTKAAIKRAGITDETWQRVEKCHAVTTARPQDEPCRFCGKSFPAWKKLTVHLAKHLEHISLPILRLVERKDVEADTIISPVQDPPPRTFAPFPSSADVQQQGEMMGGGGGGSGMPPSMMSSAQGLISRLHQPQQPPQISQPVPGYTTTSMHDTSGYMYPPVTQVTYQQQYYGQPQYGSLSSHMQSLGVANMGVSSGYATGPAFTGHPLPVAGGDFLGASTAQYAPDTSGIDASAYQTLTGSDALGLRGPPSMGGSGQLPFEPSSVGGSIGDQYRPQGSVSPYQHSPHQPQGQFFA